MAPVFHRRRQRSSLPVFLLFAAVLVGAGFLIWNLVYTPSGEPKKTVLKIGSTSTATVRLGESTNFVEIPSVGELLEAEAVRTPADDGTHLVFFDGSKVFLDQDTELTLSRVRERDQDESVDIELLLASGRIWASVPQKVNPRSKVVLKTPDFAIETQGGEFSFSPDAVQVASGRASVFVNNTFYETLEVGQELVFGEADLTQMTAGNGPQKALISAEFQQSPWFIKHMNGQSELSTLVITDTSPSPSPSGSPDAIDDEDDEDSPSGSGVRIIKPSTNETVFETGASEITISGRVPAGTQKVVVNDYTLTRFQPGDTEFSYNAAVRWGTVKEGANEYTVVAYDADGKKSEAGITIVYDPDKATPAASPSPRASAAARGGQVTIATPADGATVDDETITISGAAPAGAARIVVDGYALSQYRAGDTTWSYRLADRFGNRTVGKKSITVQAYDSSGTLIDSAQISITIEAAQQTQASAAPTATPAAAPAEGSTL